jgi:hypothetical protein
VTSGGSANTVKRRSSLTAQPSISVTVTTGSSIATVEYTRTTRSSSMPPCSMLVRTDDGAMRWSP